MFSSLLKCRYIIPFVMVSLIFGCAGMQGMDQRGHINLPDPIAISLETMPEDAAMVTVAIHDKIVMANRYKSKNVRFEKNMDTSSFLIGKE